MVITFLEMSVYLNTMQTFYFVLTYKTELGSGLQ